MCDVSYGHVEHGNKQVKVLIAKYEQPVRTGKNKGSNHCAVLKPGAAVLVCERWVELATTITRLRVRVRDEAEGCDKTHTALRPPAASLRLLFVSLGSPCLCSSVAFASMCLTRRSLFLAATGCSHRATQGGCGLRTVIRRTAATQKSTQQTTAAGSFLISRLATRI